MGLGMVIMGWLVIATVAGLFWLLCLAAFVMAWWRRWRALKLLAAIPLVAMPATAVALGVVVVISTGLGFYPPHVYHEEFHENPTIDVRDLHGFKFGIADGANCYLSFHAGRGTVKRLVANSHFLPLAEADFRSGIEGLDLTPPSWKPFAGHPTEFYSSGKFDNSFANSKAYLSYDPSSGMVHFAWTGID